LKQADRNAAFLRAPRTVKVAFQAAFKAAHDAIDKAAHYDTAFNASRVAAKAVDAFLVTLAPPPRRKTKNSKPAPIGAEGETL